MADTQFNLMQWIASANPKHRETLESAGRLLKERPMTPEQLQQAECVMHELLKERGKEKQPVLLDIAAPEHMKIEEICRSKAGQLAPAAFPFQSAAQGPADTLSP